MVLTVKELAALDIERLGAHLIELAEKARRHAIEGDAGELSEMLSCVRAAADVASGVHLLLLEVAESFLRSLVRSDLGKREVALHLFFSKHPVAADMLFARLLRPETLGSNDVVGLPDDVQAALADLVSVGVLQQQPDGLALSAAVRAAARDLHEPAALRMWRHVENCRGQISLWKLDAAQGAAYLASHLGITEEQASRFLDRSPIRHRSANVLSATARPMARRCRAPLTPTTPGPLTVPASFHEFSPIEISAFEEPFMDASGSDSDYYEGLFAEGRETDFISS